MIREIIFFGEHFPDFYEAQREKVQEKIDYVLYLISNVERVPVKFLKHIEGVEGLYEIRVSSGGLAIRIFCFFDERKLVIVLNAFQKKSQKTPANEIALAEKLKRKYFEEKQKSER